MDHPPPAPVLPSSSSPAPPSSNASVTMVVITVVGIFAAFAVLAGYYAFVTKCQPLRALFGWSSSNNNPPWQRPRARGGGGGLGQLMREPTTTSVIRAAAAASEHHRGLGLPLIRMLPVVKFTAEADRDATAGPRISVSECAVCLSEFVERERVRLLPNCSHAFHIDCIDTWLQGSARCPFCRSDVTLPAAVPLPPRRATSKTTMTRRRDADDDELAREEDSIVIEVRGERETWFGHGGSTAPAAGRRHRRQERNKAESVGDEAIDTRTTTKDEAFAVQPLRRSLSLDSSCDKHLYLSVQESLLVTTTRRQGYDYPTSVLLRSSSSTP